MNKAKRRAFWKEWCFRLKTQLPISFKIMALTIGIILIVVGIVVESNSSSIYCLLTGIILLIEAPVVFFVELKKEYAKKKTK